MNVLKLFGQQTVARARSGVSFGATGTALAVVSRDAGARPRLEHCEFLQGTGHDGARIGQILRTHDHARTRLSVVAQPEDYQLLLIEAPDVLPAELRAAVRWRLKDMINFDIDDVVVDVFDVPEPSRRAATRSTYAVAARKPALDRYIELAQGAACALDVIDIPELCLRNLCTLTDANRSGVALLLAGARAGQLVLVRNDTLYLTRHVDWSQSYDPNAAGAAERINATALALEVQRSLDYYESHHDQAPIGELLIAPLDPNLAALADALRSEVGLRVGVLDLNALLDCRTPLSAELQSQCLLAIGAALRADPEAA